jgi:cytochrome c biogenesis protein CcmG/thiol:disulfide interchange protein DsbE
VSRRHLTYAIAAVAVVAAIGADALALLGRGDVARSGGRPAPTLPDEVLVPPRVTIHSLRGRPTAINFWASWCQPCREEAPEMERLSRDLRGRASLVGVDWEDERDAALSFIQEFGWTFPVLQARGDGVAGHYGVVGLPATIILDREGRISEVLQGPQTADDLRRALGLPGSSSPTEVALRR